MSQTVWLPNSKLFRLEYGDIQHREISSFKRFLNISLKLKMECNCTCLYCPLLAKIKLSLNISNMFLSQSASVAKKVETLFKTTQGQFKGVT